MRQMEYRLKCIIANDNVLHAYFHNFWIPAYALYQSMLHKTSKHACKTETAIIYVFVYRIIQIENQIGFNEKEWSFFLWKGAAVVSIEVLRSYNMYFLISCKLHLDLGISYRIFKYLSSIYKLSWESTWSLWAKRYSFLVYKYLYI